MWQTNADAEPGEGLCWIRGSCGTKRTENLLYDVDACLSNEVVVPGRSRNAPPNPRVKASPQA
jgi:hypothetical protein